MTRRQRHWLQHVRECSFLITLLGCFYSISLSADTVKSGDLLRASVIEKIARFITWPEWNSDNFTLCVPANAALLPAIQSYFHDETIANKAVSLVLFEQLNVLQDCQLIYIDKNLHEQIPAILGVTENLPILLIGEQKNAVENGVHIDYHTENNKINIEVNRDALSKSRLTASYHLLKVARLVETR